jgi:hypothetical protein
MELLETGDVWLGLAYDDDALYDSVGGEQYSHKIEDGVGGDLCQINIPRFSHY